MKKQFQSKSVPRGTRTIWRYLSALILLFTLGIGQMWGAGTAIASLSFDNPSTLPSAYTYSSTNTPAIAEVDSKNCVNVASGGGSTAPTFSADNTSAPTGGKRWVAFQPDANCTVTFKVRAANNGRIFYLLDKDHSSTSDAVSSFTATAKNTWYDTWSVDLTAGTWYAIIGSGSNCYITSMQFAAKVTTKHSVTYALNGGTGTAPTQADVAEGSTFTVADMPVGVTPPTGKEFDKWNDGSIDYAAGATYTMGTSNVTLTAKWRDPAPKYTVTLVPAGGTISDATGWTLNAGNYEKEVAEGTNLTLPTFTKENRNFKTWRKAGPADVASPVTVNSDLTLTAIWTATVENVIYSWEGAEGGATEVGGTAVGSEDGLINIESAGYYTLKINGKADWSSQKVEITLSGDEKVKTGDKIVYWGFYNKSSSANARPKMRDGNTPNAQIFDDGTNLPNLYSGGDPAKREFTVPADINTNKVQITRSQTGSNTWISKLQIIRPTQVEESNLLTVTFNSNGGSSIDPVVVASGQAVAKPADPTKAHNRFNEWQLAGSAYNFATPVTGNITLTADWTQLYTISFAAGEGGSGDAPAAVADKAEGETFEVPANTFTAPEGKEFDKWNDGTNDYAPGATYTVGTANVTLTAVWKPLVAKYTVVFKDGETELGTKLFDVASNPSDADINKTKPLFTFVAWQKDEADIALDATFWATVAKDATVTLTARWAKAYGNNVDFEAYIHANNSEKDDVDKAEAYVLSQNYALSTKTGTTFDANSSTNNGAYEGLKIKHSGTVLSWNVAASKVVEFKAGVMVANGSLSINGGAATTIDGGTTGTGDNFKIHYFYSAAEALYEFTTSNGSAEVVKAITMRDPYTVTFNGNEGTPAVASLNGTPSVTLPNATKGTESFLGWFIGEDKIGDAGDSYIPTANVELVAHWEAISTDNTLSDLKVGGETVDGFSPAVHTYYVVLPYGTKPENIPAISATANSAKAKQVAIQQAVWTGEPYNCYRAQANVQAEDNSWGYYDVRFSFAPKDGVSLIKVATTGSTNKTVTGVYAGDGDVSLSSSKKMDNGKYIGFTLDGTTLQAGDRINVHTTQAANTGGSHIIFYDNMTDKNELYDTEEIGGTGDNIFTINAAMEGKATAYVYRANNDAAHQWNGYVDYIEVTRAMDPVLTAITIDGRAGVIDEEHKTVAVQIPHEAVLSSLTIVPTIIRNAAHATTPQAVVSNEGAWIEGANTYRVMDKDGDYTDYTITLTRDVLKHTVSFNTHGGSAVASELVVDGESLEAAPAAPEKEDYIFQGWAETDGGAIVDVTSFTISADKEFHAVWASDGGIKLLDGSTVNHANFITAVTATETVEFMGNTVNYAKFSGTCSGVSSVKDLTRVIAYNATTNKTKIRISAHNNSTSARSILVKGLVEGASEAVDLATIALGNKEDKVSDWIEFDNAANRTIYIMVSSSASDVYFTQVKVIESGETPMKQVGEAGYSLNLNKGRFFGLASTDLAFEGLNARLSSDYTALNSGYAKLNATSMSFTVASDMNLVVTTNNSKTYYVTKGAAGTDNETAKTGVSEFDLTAGTWYITAGSSEVQFTNIAFELPKCEKPAFNALQNSELCAGDPYVALDGTGTVTDGGSITYKWYAEGGTDVLGTNATYKPTADGSYYVVALHHVDGFTDNEATSDVVSVTHYASAAITTAPEDQRVDAGQNATLTVVATGKAPLTYQWYTCDENGDNADEIDGAESDSYVVAVTDGFSQYFKVVVSSSCGEASAVAKVEAWVELPQLDVTEAMTWDWTYAGENNKLVAGKNVEVVMANIKENGKQPTNDATFRSQALLFYGENVRATDGGRNYASVGHIKFNTTVAGLVKVEFSDNGSNDRRLKINDQMSESSSSKTDVKTFAAYVEAGEVTLMGVEEDGTGSNKYIRISKIEFITAPSYTRTVDPSYLGTLCWTNNAILVNATLYEFAGKDGNNYLVFDEVVENRLEAGKPYIFMPENGNTEIKVYNTDNAAALTEDQAPVNHMYGTIQGKTLTQADNADMYYFSSNHIWRVGDFNVNIEVPAYYCYIDYPAVLAEQPAPANPAPGRRRVTMGVNGQQVATGIENVQGDNVQCTKVLIDGQIFIIRGEKMFDVTGKLVK